MPIIPFINYDMEQLKEKWNDKVNDSKTLRRLVLVIVCIALLLDNMLYMVIVPIIPVYLRDINQWGSGPPPPHQQYAIDMGNVTKNYTYSDLYELSQVNDTFKAHFHELFPLSTYHGNRNEDASIGVLFASKAIVQLLVNPLSGTVIDRIGYETPMIIGLSILFFSTAVFAFGQSYGVLFAARSLQGLGSAFADTSGLAMIADRYSEENGRQKAMAIALAFISFGSLFAPPFGGLLYEIAGKSLPFLVLALIALLDGVLLFLVMNPVRKERNLLKASGEAPKGTPIYRLIMDPFILICAGALVMANLSLAFLEPTIANWMKDTMNATEWEMGVVWLPAFFPHVLGVFVTVKLCKMYPSKQWLMTAVGLALEGFSCFIIPFCKSYGAVMVPLMIDCFGIALVDTAVLPTLAYLVDVRHTSVYGSVYAIADISYCLAYAFGPILAGGLVSSMGFLWLNIAIFLINVGYAPVMALLRNVYKYKPFENDENEECTLVDGGDPRHQYKTYALNNMNGYGPGEKPGVIGNGHLQPAESKVSTTTTKPANNPLYVSENEPERISYKRQSTDQDSDNDFKSYH